MEQVDGARLRDDGYCVVRGALDAQALATLRDACAGVLETVTPDHRARFRAQGCVADIAQHPVFADAIAHPVLQRILDDLGLGGQVFCSGSVLSKPAGGPPLFWHQDWWGWDDPVSRGPRPPQVNMMVYLGPTSVRNGCLRVIPGSHRRRHALHDRPITDHLALSAVQDPDHPLYRSWDGERAVAVEAGDVVVKDARLLHSAYGNASDAPRTLLSLNYNPRYAQLPSPVQESIRRIFFGEAVQGSYASPRIGLLAWPEAQRRKVDHLVPRCAPGLAALPMNFTPALD
ncbi:MAG TPA: phytanoyl-CoA dioxygenase family protein [Ramlibacter sp.]|jgi:ectoine hydroxylase-related dioxygenase (phytanoyl-CoA dioxygenase family)